MEIIDNLKFTSQIYEILLPLSLIVLDIVTGFIYAWINKSVSSSIMREGLGHKIAEISYIVLGFLANLCFGLHSVQLFAIFYVCFMEVLSVLENVTALGFPIPEIAKEKIRKILNIINKEGE